MSTITDEQVIGAETPARRSRWGRLYHGETNIDFMGRRWWGLGISAAILVATIVSLFANGLNLGLDFEGGVQWEVPAANITKDQAGAVVEANGIDPATAKITVLTGGSGDIVRIQVPVQTPAVNEAVIDGLAKAAQIDVNTISNNSVSESWGKEITNKAVRALVVFLILVAMFIAWRFEWWMALAALLAMIHDVLISVGVYSIFRFEVTPATVIAFLTILGFSLYDTIVVFDKVKENTERFSASKIPYDDVVNVSMNQVLMRSINTSIAAVLPVMSLLIIGSGILGATSLRDFSLALLVGLLTGSYSSIFIAAPLLAWFKGRSPKYAALRGSHATGAELERLVLGGSPAARREANRVRSGSNQTPTSMVAVAATPDVLLTHPPRPRKKKRR